MIVQLDFLHCADDGPRRSASELDIDSEAASLALLRVNIIKAIWGLHAGRVNGMFGSSISRSISESHAQAVKAHILAFVGEVNDASTALKAASLTKEYGVYTEGIHRVANCIPRDIEKVVLEVDDPNTPETNEKRVRIICMNYIQLLLCSGYTVLSRT